MPITHAINDTVTTYTPLFGPGGEFAAVLVVNSQYPGAQAVLGNAGWSLWHMANNGALVLQAQAADAQPKKPARKPRTKQAKG